MKNIGKSRRRNLTILSTDGCLKIREIFSTSVVVWGDILFELKRVLRKDGECYLTLGSKQTWGFQQDWPVVDENIKIRIEDGPENGIPHFYADYDLIINLFKDFRIVKVFQVEEYVAKERTASSFHYHVLIKKSAKVPS